MKTTRSAKTHRYLVIDSNGNPVHLARHTSSYEALDAARAKGLPNLETRFEVIRLP